MKKIEIIRAGNAFEVELKVNKFMENKNVISVSYSVDLSGARNTQFVCVFYEE